MEPLGHDVLNFKSQSAYNYFISCSDTHKTWQAFEICTHGIVLELIHLYAESTRDSPLTAIGFLKWQRNSTSATLRMIFSLVLTYGLGIYTQRVGDRNNDATISNAGRYSFLDFFYGFNHPIYQEIEYRDLRNKIIYPPEIRAQLEENITFSNSTHPSRGQGGDFILEQKVKKQKMLSPKGPIKKLT